MWVGFFFPFWVLQFKLNFTNVLLWCHPQHRSLIFGLYGGLVVLVTMGWSFVALVLSHCVIIYSFGLIKRKSLCFGAGLATLASIKLEPYNSWQVSDSSICKVWTLMYSFWLMLSQFLWTFGLLDCFYLLFCIQFVYIPYTVFLIFGLT